MKPEMFCRNNSGVWRWSHSSLHGDPLRAAAEIMCGPWLGGRVVPEGWAAKDDGALVANDRGLGAHRGHIRTACGGRSQPGGDLRDTFGGQVGLVVEGAAEVLPVGEHLVL